MLEDEALPGITTTAVLPPQLVEQLSPDKIIGVDGFEFMKKQPRRRSSTSSPESEEVKKLRKKERNREAAQQFRLRQKQFMEGLQRRAEKADSLNKQLTEMISHISAENDLLREQLEYLCGFVIQAATAKGIPLPPPPPHIAAALERAFLQAAHAPSLVAYTPAPCPPVLDLMTESSKLVHPQFSTSEDIDVGV